MKIQSILFALALLAAATFGACEKSNSDNPVIRTGEVGDVGEISQKFGWDIFREVLKENPNENVLISPLSIQTAIMMAINGADGNTRAEMLQMLHCPGCDLEKLNKDMKELSEWLQNKSGHPDLMLTNGLFYDESRIFVKEGYKEALTQNYNLRNETLDFNQPEAKDKINNWVKNQTRGKIDEIVKEIGPLDLAFLINALYFRSDWAVAFPKEMTFDRDFFLSDGSTVKVPFVSNDRNFLTSRMAGYEMVDLPFRDSTFSFTLIQHSNQNVSTKDWVEEINLDLSRELYRNLSSDRAIVSFPRLSLAFDTELPESLKRLGMIDAFSEQRANFDKMGNALIGPVIYISQVNHATRLEVDEKGAEGAAVTSIGFTTTSMPPSFTFDSPFIIKLRHIPTNTIVFSGLVENPAEE